MLQAIFKERALMKIAAILLLAAPFVMTAMPALAVDGTALYSEYCAKCHGDKGGADSFRGYLYFARNFTRPAWQADRSDAEILDAIDRGPRIMPAFRKTLTQEERQALVKTVRSFGR